MGVFNELVVKNLTYAMDNKLDIFEFPFPRFAQYTGDIQNDLYTVIAGRLGSGKTSFLDYTYVFNLFMQWKAAKDRGVERPFKILYFSLNHTKQLKIQKWTSLFLYMKEELIIDIATLNNERSQLIDVDDKFKAMVEDAEEFFDAMLEDDVVQIIEGQKSPATIVNIVDQYMESIGSDVDGQYILDQEYIGNYTSVIIDSTDKLLTETTGYGSLSKIEILERMNDYALKFKNYYGISTVIVYPTPSGLIRGPKDTEPRYLDLGPFAQDCDKGFVMYDPHGEHNYTFKNIDTRGFISKTGVNRLRTVHIIKNKNGANNIDTKLGFYPENGYFQELPSTKDIEDYENVRLNLYRNE
jgi:hypothetical protein